MMTQSNEVKPWLRGHVVSCACTDTEKYFLKVYVCICKDSLRRSSVVIIPYLYGSISVVVNIYSIWYIFSVFLRKIHSICRVLIYLYNPFKSLWYKIYLSHNIETANKVMKRHIPFLSSYQILETAAGCILFWKRWYWSI